MKLLLDSHTYLWWLADDPALSEAARGAIADPGNVIYVSAATVWEIEANRFAELPVRATHAVAAARLPTHHGDPFDRILVAQSQVDGLICVTRDAAFDPYGVATLW